MAPKMLGVILTRLIQLIFNYQPRLVRLELIQNICKGKKAPRVSWRYFNKQKIEISKTESNSKNYLNNWTGLEYQILNNS